MLTTRTPVKNPLFDTMDDSALATTSSATSQPISSPPNPHTPNNLFSQPSADHQHDEQNQHTVARISVRPPPFWRENPALWFKQLESQFYTNGITVSETKFHIAVSALDTAVISQVSDIVMNPPTNGKYELLKTRLQERFADSEEQRFRKLLGNLSLGDKKPSHLWREMRELAGVNNVNDHLLKSLWLQRLPAQSQAILAAEDGSIERAISLADRVHDIFGAREVNSIMHETPASSSVIPHKPSSNSSEMSEIREQLERLEKRIASLSITKQNNHRRSRSRSSTRFSRQMSQSSTKKVNKLCWYHHRFGSDATNCVSPCEFQASEN